MDHVWHWQQWYFIIMWCIFMPFNFVAIATASTQTARLTSLISTLMACFSIFALWTGGFFS